MLVSLEDTETKPPSIKGMAALGFPGLKRKVKAFTITRLKIRWLAEGRGVHVWGKPLSQFSLLIMWDTGILCGCQGLWQVPLLSELSHQPIPKILLPQKDKMSANIQYRLTKSSLLLTWHEQRSLPVSSHTDMDIVISLCSHLAWAAYLPVSSSTDMDIVSYPCIQPDIFICSSTLDLQSSLPRCWCTEPRASSMPGKYTGSAPVFLAPLLVYVSC